MKNLSSAEIRQSFLDFFEEKGHLIVPSASLIPMDDPTLLFTNAGMNQFKDYFLGLASPPALRIADAQKILRISGKHNDLEDVGPSPYHHTFFEMLGNWSFGDYYKKEAISWAWELLTQVWGFPAERIYATVFRDDKGEIPTDDKAVGFWKSETGIDPEHILYFGRKDNLWTMGETGPCGPSSEIHFDRGPAYCDMSAVSGHTCSVNGDCFRYVEIWNLVFIQYNSLGEGRLEPLPARHVDTGAGFERLVMVMQDRESSYDTDIFVPIFRRIQDLASHSDADRDAKVTPYRVVADHSRAMAFLIGDGVLPGNVGRGYVLRMVIRRAARFGRELGFTQPFLANVVDTVIEKMGGHYRELRDRREHILTTVTQEEKRFMRTLDQGLVHLNQLLTELSAGTKVLGGDQAFDLYATFGLPLEITRDVAGEQGYAVDEEGFQAALTTHREVSGGSAFGAYGAEIDRYAELLERLKRDGEVETEGVAYDPYSECSVQARLLALMRDGEQVEKADPDDEVEVVLSTTPFYVESGGQVSDMGYIEFQPRDHLDGGSSGWRIQVTGMIQPLPGLIIHVGQVVEGQPQVGDWAKAQVDVERRRDIMRNHTATHLLHRGLRQVLGEHVQQAGSLVAPDRLRFDFTYSSAVTDDELDEISRSVNKVILKDYPLQITYEPYETALDSGVIALFGEKYGDVVRVIRIGDEERLISQELCGGTHVRKTGEIGQFHIISESSVGAGVRRIEAVTGRVAQELVADRLRTLRTAAAYMECRPEEVDVQVLALRQEAEAAQKQVNRLQQALAHDDFERMVTKTQDLDGTAFLAVRVEETDVDMLRQMTDWFRDRYPSGAVVLGTVIDDRPQLIAAVTPDLVERGLRADELVRSIARAVRGGGGGRATLAQAGGRDAGRLDEALSTAREFVAERLG